MPQPGLQVSFYFVLGRKTVSSLVNDEDNGLKTIQQKYLPLSFSFFLYLPVPSVFSVPSSFIHKMNTVEFKSATFPNAGSRHLLDDSVMESHSPTRGQAESSTLSSGISLGKTYTCILIIMMHSLSSITFFVMICICLQGAVRALSSVKRCLGQLLRGKVNMSVSAVLFHHIHM